MYPRLTTAPNRVAIISGILLICLVLQIRAGGAEVASGPVQSAPASAILFASNGGLWVINSDGSGLKELTHFTDQTLLPVAESPDGNRIVYVNYRRLEGSPLMHPNLWIMNADGSGVRPLTGERKRVFDSLAWSPDGHKIAAISNRVDFDEDKQIKYPGTDILMVNADGSVAKPLIEVNNPGIFFDQLTWSPDGRKIAFLSNRPLDSDDGNKVQVLNRNIWVMDADGSHVIPLTRFTGTTPRIWEKIGWSPDSRKVTYISERPLDDNDASRRGLNIWVSNADGSGSLPVTRFKNVTCNAFSWSPDGSLLSFSSNDSLDGSDTGNSNFNIWVMKADGASPVPLTRETVLEISNDRPAWSPDGSSIAFASCINPSSANHRTSAYCKLSVMNVDGTGSRQLTEQNVGVIRWRKCPPRGGYRCFARVAGWLTLSRLAGQ